MRILRIAASRVPAMLLVFSVGAAGCTEDEDISPSADSGEDASLDTGAPALDSSPSDASIDSTVLPDALEETSTTDSSAPDGTGADVVDADGAPSDTAIADGGDAVAVDSADSVAMDVASDASPSDTAVVDSADDGSADAADAADAADGADAGPPSEAFTATLSGDDENPKVTTSASGNATCSLAPGTNRLSCLLTHTVTGASAANIHVGSFGLNSAAVFSFSSGASGTTTAWDLSSTTVSDLRAGKLYVNVVSSANPDGELRGTLIHPGEVIGLAGRWAPYEAGATGAGGIQLILSVDGLTYRYYGRLNNAVGTPNGTAFVNVSDGSEVAGLGLTMIGAAPTTAEFLGSFAKSALPVGLGNYVVVVKTDSSGAVVAE